MSERERGLLNDAKLAGSPAPMKLEAISAPTLAVSLEDDRFQTLAAARHLAESIPNARLLTFPEGGHVWVGHNDEVIAAINEILVAAFRNGSKPRTESLK